MFPIVRRNPLELPDGRKNNNLTIIDTFTFKRSQDCLKSFHLVRHLPIRFDGYFRPALIIMLMPCIRPEDGVDLLDNRDGVAAVVPQISKRVDGCLCFKMKTGKTT